MLDYLYAAILGVIQGLTEFLPISSTGHLLITSAVFGFPTAALGVSDPAGFRDTFAVFIQLGTVFSVLVFYARDLLGQLRSVTHDPLTQRFWVYLFLAFVPAGAVGFLLRDWIQATLYNPPVIGAALALGGVVLLLIERMPRQPTTHQAERITLGQTLSIGLMQMVALIPGVSRSGASIVGGLLSGLDRVAATKFSFYLALPSVGIATVYQLVSALRDGMINAEQLPILLLGAAVAFVVGWMSIAWLLRFVARNTFRPFGWYRIAIGALILFLALFTQALSG
ncbi:MAG: undecaprenyl-diphosphate phosphatase [Anaerolineae bacterium]|nr:undecaprenyl-diphosphate phosphatase [Anaerolineae bacterium]